MTEAELVLSPEEKQLGWIASGLGPFRALAARRLLEESGLRAHRVAGTERIIFSEQVAPGRFRPIAETTT